MKVKICGLMLEEDVQAAVENGADAVGFIVQSPSSPRNLSLKRAERLVRSVPLFTSRVAVTIADDVKVIKKICSSLRPDALQLYRKDSRMISSIRRAYPEIRLILVNGIRDQASLIEGKRIASESDAVLADTVGKRRMGGTGRVHDWKLTATLRKAIYPRPLILAGGLTPTNVRSAISAVEPYGVDVSSGVERTIGVKDHRKIREFVANAKGVSI